MATTALRMCFVSQEQLAELRRDACRWLCRLHICLPILMSHTWHVLLATNLVYSPTILI